MNFDINTRTIFKTLTGSRVYGTSSPTSDYDHRGVAVPPKAYFYGNMRFEQHEARAEDLVIFEIRKFLHLAGQNNPNILELLFVDPKFWVLSTPYWERIVAVRPAFLSKKCYHTYRGYAHSQIRRVRTHRGWLLQGELVEPKRSDFGLADAPPVPSEVLGAANALVVRFLQQADVEEDLAEVAKVDRSVAMALRQRMEEFLERTVGLAKAEIDQHAWTAAAKLLGYDTNFVDLLLREKKYQQAKANYKSWQHWKAERNEARKEIEERCGFDAKHMLHVFRLMGCCKEILETQTLNVTRPDADFLAAIRAGKYSFEELEEMYAKMDEELGILYQTSALPHTPQHAMIETVGLQVVEQYLADNG